MTNIDIYSILESKPHNPHYLKRYWKFIQSCKTDGIEYTENHHICPKALDLFPEFSFAKWNNKKLTADQHIVAHIILWKAYGGSQALALECILGQFNSDTNPKTLSNRKIPGRIKRRYLALAREDACKFRGLIHKNTAVYKDLNGNMIGKLPIDDEKVLSGEYVGNNMGLVMNEESREAMRRAKDVHRVTTINFLTMKQTVLLSDLQMYLDQGWTLGLSDDDREFNSAERYELVSEKLTGRKFYSTHDGTYFGRLHDDDPAIALHNLIISPKTEAQNESSRTNQVKASEFNTDSVFYNNGSKNKKFKTDPGSPWKLGCIDWDRSAQTSATSAKLKNTETWNDGIRNYRVKPGQQTPGMVRGMAPQKQRQYPFTNGVVNVKLYSKDPVPDGYFRGTT